MFPRPARQRPHRGRRVIGGSCGRADIDVGLVGGPIDRHVRLLGRQHLDLRLTGLDLTFGAGLFTVTCGGGCVTLTSGFSACTFTFGAFGFTVTAGAGCWTTIFEPPAAGPPDFAAACPVDPF